eukprot:g923.t1
MSSRPGIYGFDHLVVRLEDFDAGVAAYSKLLGHAPERLGEHEGMGMKMAFYDLPNGGFIEVVAPTRADSVLRPALDKSGAGMNLVSFQCEDLAATVKMMKQNGVRILEDKNTGAVTVHPKSTHGVLMQLKEKEEGAPRAAKGGLVPDTSGKAGAIVSYKCTLIFVKDIKAAIATYEALGLKLHFEIENKAAHIIQAGFFLRGGGLIELIGPVDPNDANDGFVKHMQKRGEGFQQMSLDASAGAIDALEKAGIKLKVTDGEHADIDKSCTMTPSILLQLNPVGMGQDYQVEDFVTRKPPAAKPKASL